MARNVKGLCRRMNIWNERLWKEFPSGPDWVYELDDALAYLDRWREQLRFFMESWDRHQIRIRNGPNRSPADMFGFDMLVHGVRGTDTEFVHLWTEALIFARQIHPDLS
ncbi:hypothetical protein B0H11DRAFT_2241111 [Mycena galericulata]|nr:hypothetical protein B0H11DRAFT_2241111 [Mycena galericulata]